MVHPLKNILNRLRWDSRENPDDYLITYRHRGAPGDEKQIRASCIKNLGKSYFTILSELGEEEIMIPFHRILEIRNTPKNSIIWTSRHA
ncbi:MAG TPA: RNA repair domain-containing protein [Candidatus Dormibacteraeota bacterium]|nr:RNA repair domain-containing protein [Candidatus Dormibacteraeota bacterium]